MTDSSQTSQSSGMDPGGANDSGMPVAAISRHDLLDVVGLLSAIIERRVVVLGTILFFLAIAALYLFLARPIYTAQSVIEMHIRRPRIVGEAGAVLGEDVKGAALVADAMNTQFHKLQGPTVRGRVVEALRRQADTVQELRGHTPKTLEHYLINVTKLQRVRRTYLVNIVIESESPVLAAVIANAYARTAVSVVKDLTRDISMQAVAWLREQIETYEREVLNNEAKLIAFGQKHSVGGLQSSLAASQQALVQISNDLVEHQTIAATREDTVRTLVAVIQSPETAGTLPSSTPRASIIHERLARYSDALVEMERVLTRYTEKHPTADQASRNLEAAHDALTAEVARAIETAKADLSIAKAHVASIEANKVEQISLAEGLQRKIDQYNTDVIPLQRALESSDSSYKGLLARIEQARLAADEETSLVTVYEMASTPSVPTRPRRKMVLALCLAIGAGSGVVLALLVHTLQDRVSAVRDIEVELGENLLGVVPHVPRSRGVKRMATISNTDKFSFVAEALAGLRTALSAQGHRPEDRGWVILVTSANPAEGKTSTACNLAIAMSKVHDRVFVIDGDMRRPQLHNVFDVADAGETLMEVLVADEAHAWDFATIPQSTEIKNIDIALGHPIEGVSPTEVLETGKFQQFVEWARNNYSVVIIDSPPLGILSESIVFGRMADDVVLVCRYDKTRKGALRQATRDLKKNRCPLTGIVLNGYKATGVERGYGYQYYGYSRYSKRYAAEEKPRKRRDKPTPA